MSQLTNTSAPPPQQTLAIKLQFKRDAFAVDVNLALPAQGITAIFGPSGCGKTSLLRALAGLENSALDPRSCFVSIAGTVWQSPTLTLPTHQRRVGYVFQEASLFDHLSVQDNLNFARKRAAENHKIDAAEIIALLDLPPLLARMPAHLSGGERQRVALGRALLANPTLLLLDEPLAALDEQRKREILPYLERLQRFLSIPVIYVSHALDEVVQLADHLLLMERGRITAQGSPSELLNSFAPLAQRDDAFSLLEGTVLDLDHVHHLTRIRVGESVFLLPTMVVQQSTKLRIRVFARDVSVCLAQPNNSSILNILPATIIALTQPHKGQCLLHLALAQHRVLARISQYSCEQLQLAPGKQVFAQIKALALMK